MHPRVVVLLLSHPHYHTCHTVGYGTSITEVHIAMLMSTSPFLGQQAILGVKFNFFSLVWCYCQLDAKKDLTILQSAF